MESNENVLTLLRMRFPHADQRERMKAEAELWFGPCIAGSYAPGCHACHFLGMLFSYHGHLNLRIGRVE